MTRNHILRKTALALPFAGALLVSYSTARPAQTDALQLGAQIVAQGTTNGAIACARCHGFDGQADGSGAFPKLAGQFPQYLAKQLRAYASGARLNALMQPIAKGLKDAEIDSVAQTTLAFTLPRCRQALRLRSSSLAGNSSPNLET